MFYCHKDWNQKRMVCAGKPMAERRDLVHLYKGNRRNENCTAVLWFDFEYVFLVQIGGMNQLTVC